MEDFKSTLSNFVKSQNSQQLQLQERIETQPLQHQERMEKLLIQTQKETHKKSEEKQLVSQKQFWELNSRGNSIEK